MGIAFPLFDTPPWPRARADDPPPRHTSLHFSPSLAAPQGGGLGGGSELDQPGKARPGPAHSNLGDHREPANQPRPLAF